MIPNLHPPPGVIIDTQLEIVLDVKAPRQHRKGPETLVPHVITHYDFTQKTSSTGVYTFPMVPQEPKVFDLEIRFKDCNLQLMMRRKLLVCKTIQDVR